MIEETKKGNRIAKKLTLLNINMNYRVFVIFRIITTLIIFLLLLFISKVGIVFAPIISIIYYILFEYVTLDNEIKKRRIILEYDALEFFPIFLISLKGNRNIKVSLNETVSVVNNKLSLEFKRVLDDVKIGKSLNQSLKDLDKRIPSDLINNIIVNIIEASRVGNDISDSILIELRLIDEKLKKSELKRYKYIPLELALTSIIFVFLSILFLILFILVK